MSHIWPILLKSSQPGDVTTDVTSMEAYKGRGAIRSDVVLPQTNSDESSAELEIGVVGVFGKGAPWP